MKKVKILKCRNKFLWYQEELLKPLRQRRAYNFVVAPDKKGVVTRKGYIFKGDYKIITN